MTACSSNASRYAVPARRSAAALCAAAVIAMMGAPAGAETFAQRQACKPDVFRLCSQFIPDREAITQCLAHNRTQLSNACHAVFDQLQK